MLKCGHCGEVFDEDEVRRIPEYVDDSRIVAFYSYECPFCGSEDIDDYYDSGEENETDDTF